MNGADTAIGWEKADMVVPFPDFGNAERYRHLPAPERFNGNMPKRKMLSGIPIIIPRKLLTPAIEDAPAARSGDASRVTGVLAGSQTRRLAVSRTLRGLA
jgi:hypothetical protein